jgi:hypothetical protein
MTDIKTFAAQKTAVATAKAQRHTRKAVLTAASSISRAGRAKANAEVCNEAIVRLLGLLYEYDPDIDDFPNIDAATGRILVYVPWSFHNHKRWGLLVGQADVLRDYLLRLQVLFESGRQNTPPVFLFDRYARRWELNIHDYPKLSQALAYFEKREITAKLFARYAKTAQAKRKTPRK